MDFSCFLCDHTFRETVLDLEETVDIWTYESCFIISFSWTQQSRKIEREVFLITYYVIDDSWSVNMREWRSEWERQRLMNHTRMFVDVEKQRNFSIHQLVWLHAKRTGYSERARKKWNALVIMLCACSFSFDGEWEKKDGTANAVHIYFFTIQIGHNVQITRHPFRKWFTWKHRVLMPTRKNIFIPFKL